MEESKARKLVVDTGKDLLDTGLVARTWGNVSCRLNEDNIVITPSGLDYTKTGEEDIVRMNLTTGDWQGIHKPSGERKVHIAAYQVYPEVNFVIHTHQTYASALGLAGFQHMDITSEEKDRLGGIMLAEYGLPGTKKLTNAVKLALQGGAKVVLMKHHGVLICGSSKEETMGKAILLEEICRRNIKGGYEKSKEVANEDAQILLIAVRDKFGYASLIQTPAVIECANRGTPIYAQLDDMAQMIGRKIPLVPYEREKIIKALEKVNAVLVPGVGAYVRAEAEDDKVALELLVEKAAVCSIHTDALKVKARIGIPDAALMKFFYQKKYSKQKS